MISTTELTARKVAYVEAEKIRSAFADLFEDEDLEVRFDSKAVQDITAAVNKEARHWGNYFSTRKVGQWVNEPNRHSPYVDHVAIERALAWDAGVIARLTDLERDEFIHQLSIDLDPWGAESEERGRRFMALPAKERESWKYLASAARRARAA